MLKQFGRHPILLNALGSAIAGYVRFVGATTRWSVEPGDIETQLGPELPVIVSTWHGQHFFTPLAWPKKWKVSALVARHSDGEINAIAIEKLGIHTIRGSGGPGSQAKLLKRGGMQALRLLVRTLKEGYSVCSTADVPKVGGVVGQGIVLLAKISGRPIYPLAVVTRWRVHVSSWDRATLSLPFGRGGMVIGEPVLVAADADDEALEAARLEVGRKLNAANARAYELAGGKAWENRVG